MRDDQLTELLELYAVELQDRFHAVPRQFEDRPGLAGYARLVAQLDHVLWMIAQMHKGMQPGVNAWDGKKLNRWLGFIQGVLWMAGAYTIDELRQQTRVFAQREAPREA